MLLQTINSNNNGLNNWLVAATTDIIGFWLITQQAISLVIKANSFNYDAVSDSFYYLFK